MIFIILLPFYSLEISSLFHWKQKNTWIYCILKSDFKIIQIYTVESKFFVPFFYIYLM